MHLVYCARNEESAAHFRELVALAEDLPNFTLTLHASEKSGRVTAETILEMAGLDASNLFLAFRGPEAMRKALTRGFAARGVAVQKIRYEKFVLRAGMGLRALAAYLPDRMLQPRHAAAGGPGSIDQPADGPPPTRNSSRSRGHSRVTGGTRITRNLRDCRPLPISIGPEAGPLSIDSLPDASTGFPRRRTTVIRRPALSAPAPRSSVTAFGLATDPRILPSGCQDRHSLPRPLDGLRIRTRLVPNSVGGCSVCGQFIHH